MDRLHTRYGIVHRDLKASNILLWTLGEDLPDNNSDVTANVADYECSVGVLGTGFWRAPEILAQLKNGVLSFELIFTKESDVYSYGMICYEILTGSIPFEGRSAKDYDYVLDGNRPILPTWIKPIKYIILMVQRCWHPDPSRRPTFSKIVEVINEGASRTPYWWEGLKSQYLPVAPEALACAREEAKTLFEDARKRKNIGETTPISKDLPGRFEFDVSEIVKFRGLCRDYGEGVFSNLPSGGRVDLYAAAINYVFDVCVKNEGLPEEGVVKFIGGLSPTLGPEEEYFGEMLIEHVVRQTCAIFLKAIVLVVQDKFEDASCREEFEGLIQIYETFSPARKSRSLENLACEFAAAYSHEARRRVLDLYISYGGRDTLGGTARRALFPLET